MEAQVGKGSGGARPGAPISTILTLEVDAKSQQYFNDLRQQHYPAALNQIAAHITLFHTLGPHDEIAGEVQRAAQRPAFPLRVTGLRSLGRGVAFTLNSEELMRLHADLAREFDAHLTRQDRQRFWPHVVIQNKTTPQAARDLLSRMQAEFVPFEVMARGLAIWDYLGGPWRHAASYSFS